MVKIALHEIFDGHICGLLTNELVSSCLGDWLTAFGSVFADLVGSLLQRHQLYQEISTI